MDLKQKFSFKTMWFMLASVFKAAPVLFPLFIFIKILQTVLGVAALYVLKDATNFVADVLVNKSSLNNAIIYTFIYLILL